MSVSEYAHPEEIATKEWLAEHLQVPDLRIVDVRWDQKDAYTSEHIPGAVYADVVNDLMEPNGPVVSRIPPADRFDSTLQQLGISNDTTVVVYDTAGGTDAARLWWALRYYGHEAVKLLNGGLTQWKLEARPVETGVVVPNSGTFVGHVQAGWRVRAEEVKQAIGNSGYLLIDALTSGEYKGEVAHASPLRAGHISTARNLPAPDNLDPATQLLLPREELERRWAALGLQPAQMAIAYCEWGVWSAFDLFVLYQLGHQKFSLYEASLMEWAADPELPMETG